MSDEQAGPHIETTRVVRVKATVSAKIVINVRVSSAEVAKWAEVPLEDVTEALAVDYVTEEYPLDEEEWDEVDVQDWEKVDGEVIATHRVRVTPPGWQSLWGDEHQHTDRGNRDMCQAGRCYLDTIVPASLETSPNPS